jgi:MYXO-CTERM domain-containing protein
MASASSDVAPVRISGAPGLPQGDAPPYPPNPVAGVPDLDDITAVSTIPGPSTVAPFATGALGLLLARRRSTPR